MSGESGFTLIEALVAGMISVIIPGVVITLLRVNNSELARNSGSLLMTQVSDAVSGDFRNYGARAAYVYSGDDAGPIDCPMSDPPANPDDRSSSPADSVVFCSADKKVFKSYRVVPLPDIDTVGTLEERDSASEEWKPFLVGEDTIRLDLNVENYDPKNGGLFGIGSEAHFLYFNFHYHMNVAGASATLPMQTETLVCRNSAARNW